MAKGSDNEYPKIILVEQASTPDTPAAGTQKLFIDEADHALKMVDENDIVSPVAGSAPDFPDAASFFVDEATKTVGNAFTLTLDALERYGWWQYQNSAANGDTWEKKIFLKAGTYTISVLGMTAPSRGIQEVFIDNVSVGTIDWYNASLVYNQVKTIAGVTVTGDGRHTFKSVINGKNASSSDYQLLLTKVWIK
jgi:hypothetical protein